MYSQAAITMSKSPLLREVTRLSKFMDSICSSMPMDSAMYLATSTSMPAYSVIAASAKNS